MARTHENWSGIPFPTHKRRAAIRRKKAQDAKRLRTRMAKQGKRSAYESQERD